MKTPINAILAAMMVALASSSFANEAVGNNNSSAVKDINNGYEDYTIRRPIHDLSDKEKKLANYYIFDCYLGCHRPAMEEVPETLSPKLEGLDPQYIFDQWVDMDNERHSGISSQMKLMAYYYTPEEMANVAIVLGSKTMSYNPHQSVLESEAFQRGKEKYDASCKMCHGEQGASTDSRFPPLKGQMPTYLFEQLVGYRDGKRTNRDAPMMIPFAKIHNETDYKEIIAYVTGQSVVPVNRKEYITGEGMPAPKDFVLPATGQIQNFTDVFGEDSDYIENPMSFTISDSGKVTLDNNTKLMWEREASRMWMTAEEGEQYCANLELDGYTDWRYPLIKELQSIGDMGDYMPALDVDAFVNMPRMASGIWTFPVSDHPDHAWHIGFPDAHVMGQHTASTKLVRCVRADNGAAYHNMSYVDNKDGTVTEKVTNRMWQQKIDYQRRDWYDSIQYCEDLDYAGYSDWRLPNMREALSIVNFNKTSPAIDEEFFPDTPIKYYFWTSSSDVGGIEMWSEPLGPRKKDKTAAELDLRHMTHHGGWAQGYQIGSGYAMKKDVEFYTRCIRNP
ncbi:DUF1566 domain-containing protein [Vibrio sp. SM6]|uniref:DUF1566 domain-containing protein n=1 Tax=Vibrio agarilyticus TaxID=2726741 RepID=A0A7X8TPH7_9VIBR|nr:DUF1566 domain-containing protein [Vibrio agarilyticus]NLS12498.1 DUF1566 domain-containing protein [Vibrio agarilyticus]